MQYKLIIKTKHEETERNFEIDVATDDPLVIGEAVHNMLKTLVESGDKKF